MREELLSGFTGSRLSKRGLSVFYGLFPAFRASLLALLLSSFFTVSFCHAQASRSPKGVVTIDPRVGRNDTIILPAIVINGDTMGHIWIGNVDVADKMIYHTDAEKMNYLRLKHDVLAVLPYARYAGYRFKALQAELSQTTDARKKRMLIKALEKEIRQNYAAALTNLTITQGRILIKLVDRETGKTSYSIVKEMKSGFSAFVFQSVAGLFGDNLKDHYDPVQDKDIEFIIQSMGSY